MPGAQCTRSLVCEDGGWNAHEYSQRVHRNSPAFPHAMVLTVSFALSPVTNSFCHRRRGLRCCRTRLGSQNLRRLDTSNGCQDHTTSPYAAVLPLAATGLVPVRRSFSEGGISAVRLACRRSLTESNSPCDPGRTPDAAASTASRPAFVIIASRPFQWDETAVDIAVIGSRKGAAHRRESSGTKTAGFRPPLGFDGSRGLSRFEAPRPFREGRSSVRAAFTGLENNPYSSAASLADARLMARHTLPCHSRKCGNPIA